MDKEQQQKEEEIREIREINLWLDSVSDFKFNKEVFNFSEFEAKSIALKNAFRELNTYFENNNPEESKSYKERKHRIRGIRSRNNNPNNPPNPEEKFSLDINEITILRNELIEKAKTVLGSLLSGPIINGRMVSRNGRIYFFRRRCEMRFDRILGEISLHQNEVIGKLNSEQRNILAYIFNFAKDINSKDIDEEGDYYKTMKSVKSFKAVSLTIPDNRSISYQTITSFDIDGLQVSGRGIQYTSSGDTQNVPTFIEDILKKQHLNLIEEARQELMAKVANERTRLDYYKNEMDGKFAKILISRKFQDEGAQ